MVGLCHLSVAVAQEGQNLPQIQIEKIIRYGNMLETQLTSTKKKTLKFKVVIWRQTGFDGLDCIYLKEIKLNAFHSPLILLSKCMFRIFLDSSN